MGSTIPHPKEVIDQYITPQNIKAHLCTVCVVCSSTRTSKSNVKKDKPQWSRLLRRFTINR